MEATQEGGRGSTEDRRRTPTRQPRRPVRRWPVQRSSAGTIGTKLCSRWTTSSTSHRLCSSPRPNAAAVCQRRRTDVPGPRQCPSIRQLPTSLALRTATANVRTLLLFGVTCQLDGINMLADPKVASLRMYEDRLVRLVFLFFPLTPRMISPTCYSIQLTRWEWRKIWIKVASRPGFAGVVKWCIGGWEVVGDRNERLHSSFLARHALDFTASRRRIRHDVFAACHGTLKASAYQTSLFVICKYSHGRLFDILHT